MRWTLGKVGWGSSFPATAIGEWWAEASNSDAFVDASPVTTWDNQVGPEDMVQMFAGFKPLYDADGLNGLPCVSFFTAGTPDNMRADLPAMAAPSPMSIVLVAKMRSFVTGEKDFITGSLTLGAAEVAGDPWWIETAYTSDGAFTATTADTSPHVFAAIYHVGESKFYLDGAELAWDGTPVIKTDNGFPSGVILQIMGESDVGYLQAFSGVLTAAEREAREAWAISHYGL